MNFTTLAAPPHFSQVPSQVSYVQAGDSLRLTCQAESTPSPVLRWYKVSMLIHHSPFILITDRPTDRLTDLEPPRPSLT